jgi:ribosomal protein L7Ae-like RNA K-turn-binding protein
VIPKSALGLLGLGARGGGLVIGTSGVRAALQQDELALVIVASDASQRTRDKVVRLASAKGVQVATGPNAVELGQRLGRPGTVQAVGVLDRHLAAGISGSLLKQEE